MPDYQGLFLRGLGSYDAARTSRALGQVQEDQFQGHRHFDEPDRRLTFVGGSGSSVYGGSGYRRDVYYETDGTIPGSYNAPRAGMETRPANVAVRYLVRALQ